MSMEWLCARVAAGEMLFEQGAEYWVEPGWPSLVGVDLVYADYLRYETTNPVTRRQLMRWLSPLIKPWLEGHAPRLKRGERWMLVWPSLAHFQQVILDHDMAEGGWLSLR